MKSVHVCTRVFHCHGPTSKSPGLFMFSLKDRFGIEDNGRPAAVPLTLIIDFSLFEEQHSYNQIIRGGTFKSHDPEGDYLYGIEVFVDPSYQGMRLGRRLHHTRKELAENLT